MEKFLFRIIQRNGGKEHPEVVLHKNIEKANNLTILEFRHWGFSSESENEIDSSNPPWYEDLRAYASILNWIYGVQQCLYRTFEAGYVLSSILKYIFDITTLEFHTRLLCLKTLQTYLIKKNDYASEYLAKHISKSLFVIQLQLKHV